MAANEIKIGEWTFDAASGRLSRGAEQRSLEHRAARTLDLLARRRGEIVSHEDIVAEVWNGRHLSPNSLPVVIGDLRRALGDDARSPRYIETIAKRGYRLRPEGPEQAVSAETRSPARRWAAAAAVLVIALAAAIYLWRAEPERPIAVFDVTNATGDAAYDPLAGKVSELVALSLADEEGLSLVRNQPPPRRGLVRSGRPVRLDAKLILWTGTPTVMFTAVDAETGKVVWSGMAGGPEPRFPVTVDKVMGGFAATMREGGGD